jgi:hypothetical protein
VRRHIFFVVVYAAAESFSEYKLVIELTGAQRCDRSKDEFGIGLA